MIPLTRETLGADLLYAFRVLLRHPGFTVASVAALALAIGANVTVFTLANAFLFKNLPFDDSDRILYISGATAARPGVARGVSYPDFVDYRSQARSVDDLAALVTCSVDVSDGRGFPERYRCAQLTANALRVIGQRPVQGRGFRDDDAVRGAPSVVIIGYGIWQTRYAADSTVVGRTIRINDVPTTIIGVMPKGLTFPGASDLWLPLVRPEAMRRGARTLTLFARTRPDTPVSAVRSEMNVIAARLATTYPDTNKDLGVLVQNFNDRFNGGETARVLVWLLWAVGFVLVIACANVANLLLARAVGRSREMSIRASLGATRGRVIQQLLIESAVLATTSALLGWLLGVWACRCSMPHWCPPSSRLTSTFNRCTRHPVSRCHHGRDNAGLWPRARPAIVSAGHQLDAEGRRQRRRTRTRCAAAVDRPGGDRGVAGGCPARGCRRDAQESPEHEPRRYRHRTRRHSLPERNLRAAKYPTVESAALFYDGLKQRLEARPGIEAVAIASDLPAESPDVMTFEVEGSPSVPAAGRPRAAGLIVGEGYFRTMV